MKSRVPAIAALMAVVSLAAPSLPASEPGVTIRSNFPGGNVVVEKVENGLIHLAPDLRGGPPWFYWHFEAEASRAATVTFSFARPPMIGSRGPAVSRDGGGSWRWLGSENVRYAPPATQEKERPTRSDTFSYTFSEAKEKVRFAVAIPYLHQDLEDFLMRNAANPHLKRGELTTSRLGKRSVDLLQIGKPGPNRRAVLMTARHHACESMASYVLEGILQEAMSESGAAVKFREKYVLYAVPIVDRDGVEAGDQGKNRLPRDYNRDYGVDSIYPEIKAIQELADLRNIQLSLDLHCPFLRGDIHDAFYYVGLGLPHIKSNLREFTAWLKEERPQLVMTPVDLIDPKKASTPNPTMNSHHFALRKNALFAATLEVPYTQPNCPLDAALARNYGRGILKAWSRTVFVAANDEHAGVDHARLALLRSQFSKIYRSQPREAEQLANSILDGKDTAAVYRLEANNSLALLRLHQRDYAAARKLSELVLDDCGALVSQKAAAALLCVRTVCADPKSTAADVEVVLGNWREQPYPSLESQTQALDVVSDFYSRKQDHDKALCYTREQLSSAANYEKGKLLNRMAVMQELLKRPDDALVSRKEAVAYLRARLGPVPERSVFGARMTFDLFEALVAIPTTPLEEKRAAAALVLNHEVASAEMKATVRRVLSEIEKKSAR